MEDLSRYYALLKDPTRRKIIEILGTREKIGFKELRETLGLGIGTVYYHLDMLSDFIEQDKHRKYKLNDKGRMLYSILKDGAIPSSISETFGHRVGKWLFLSRLFALTVKPIRFLPISAAVLIFGAIGTSMAKLEPALFFYFPHSTYNPVILTSLFVSNWIGLFVFVEILTYAFFKRVGNDLQLFACLGLAAVPLAAFPYMYMAVPTILANLGLHTLEPEMVRQAILVALQIWSLLLISAAFCHGKGLRFDKGILISLTAIYLNMTALFMFGKFT